LTLISAWQVLGQVIEIVEGARVLQSHSVVVYGSTWSFVRVLVELTTSSILVWIAYAMWRRGEDVVSESPVTIMYVILLRWLLLIMSLLMSNWFGPALLPAFFCCNIDGRAESDHVLCFDAHCIHAYLLEFANRRTQANSHGNVSNVPT